MNIRYNFNQFQLMDPFQRYNIQYIHTAAKRNRVNGIIEGRLFDACIFSES